MILENSLLKTVKAIFRPRDTAVYEIGPLTPPTPDGLYSGVFVEVNGFFRWYDLWVGVYVDLKSESPDVVLYVVCLMFGLKIKLFVRNSDGRLYG